MPHFHDSRSTRRQHAILQTVKILAMYRRHKFARRETEKDTRRQIVLSNSVAKLEILVKHCTKGQRNRLNALASCNIPKDGNIPPGICMRSAGVLEKQAKDWQVVGYLEVQNKCHLRTIISVNTEVENEITYQAVVGSL